MAMFKRLRTLLLVVLLPVGLWACEQEAPAPAPEASSPVDEAVEQTREQVQVTPAPAGQTDNAADPVAQDTPAGQSGDGETGEATDATAGAEPVQGATERPQ